jgi:toxin CptA
MAVHYFVFERRHRHFGYLFVGPRDSRLKAVNAHALIAFGAGLVMTWLFMYGALPTFQGPIATAMGGVDLSWLAGALTSGVLYFALSYPRFRQRIHPEVPLGVKDGVSGQEYLDAHGDAAQGAEPPSSSPAPGTSSVPAP